MTKYIEMVEQRTLPVIPMRGTVSFPAVPLNFEVTRPFSIAAAERACADDMTVLLLTQRNIGDDEPAPEALYTVGTVARIKQTVKTPDGNLRVLAEPKYRAEVLACTFDGDIYRASVVTKAIHTETENTLKTEALLLEMTTVLEKLLELIPSVSSDVLLAAKSMTSPGVLADFIAATVLVRYEDKQAVLEEFEPVRRAEKTVVLMEQEHRLLRCEMSIHKKVKEQIDRNQRDYYLREQMKVIQGELGQDGQSEIDEYYDRVDAADLPDEVREKLYKEIGRMAKTAFGSPEATVLKNYLDVCLEIPWNQVTKDRVNIAAAKKILDDDHDGLTKIKERMLEFIAVKQLNPDIGNQIICLVGPPGVGKTSLGASVARALGRKYARVSLGGIRDEADIRGHRKTYVGAMPGRIIDALVKCESRNPVMLLDEIDKVCRDAHGDPSSALLEVLDPEQNKSFRDHFVELPIDLSSCMFIATANTLDTIPAPLIDRMEIIELHTYSRTEKLAIAKNHLVPKQLKRHGLSKRALRLSDETLLALIDGYTREAGVRNLEREIASLCRRAAKKLIEEKKRSVTIKPEELPRYLGPIKVLPTAIAEADEVGVVNGLAYTSAGGDMLKIEVAVMDGTGKLELTGTLGDVMKESAQIACSYIRAHARELDVDPAFRTKHDIHIHVPEGAVPKDGPSAGVTMVTALVSALSGKAVRRDVAMTGEITLTGNVLAIGGLKEKTMAAYACGVKTVLIPRDNVRDLEEIDPVVRASLEFIPVSRIEQVLCHALVLGADEKVEAPEAQPLCRIVPEQAERTHIHCQTTGDAR